MLALLLTLAAAINGHAATVEQALLNLQQAEAQWNTSGPQDYRFTWQQFNIAFPRPETIAPIEVTVRKGKVANAVFAAAAGSYARGARVWPATLRRELAPTIPQLFARTREFMTVFPDERVVLSGGFYPVSTDS